MNKFYKTPAVTSIVMLLFALFDMPQGYFTLLRIIVAGTAIYFVFTAYGIKKMSWVWTMGFIAILFNPFIPIHFFKGTWSVIDFIVACIFTAGIFALSGEGVTKSLFQTKAFKEFRKITLITIGCTFIVSIIYVVAVGIRNNKTKSTQVDVPDFVNSVPVPQENSKHFDLNSARSVDGDFIETYDDGKILIIGKNRDGKPDGAWKVYDNNGNLKVEKHYQNGIISQKSMTFFDENGNKKSGTDLDVIPLLEAPNAKEYDITTRDSYKDIRTDYIDDDFKIKLLPPYFLTLDGKEYLFFEFDIEVNAKPNKMRTSYSLIEPDRSPSLHDNFDNYFSCNGELLSGLNTKSELYQYVSSKNQHNLSYGDTGKIIYYTSDKPLKNVVYFELKMRVRYVLNKAVEINFVFPKSYIKE